MFIDVYLKVKVPGVVDLDCAQLQSALVHERVLHDQPAYSFYVFQLGCFDTNGIFMPLVKQWLLQLLTTNSEFMRKADAAMLAFIPKMDSGAGQLVVDVELMRMLHEHGITLDIDPDTCRH